MSNDGTFTKHTRNYSGHYGEEQYVSDTHRTLGDKIMSTNLDCVEYHYVNGEIELIAFIDYKEGHIGKLVNTSAKDAQKKMAALLGLPMFEVLTYLDPDKYDIKMYYVIPLNQEAKDLFTHLQLPLDGKWLSIKNYARFQHYLRKIKVNEEEIKHLDNRKTTYPLPKIKQ